MPPINLIENVLWLSAGVPIDTTGAAFNGDYVDMSLADELWVMIQQGAWAGGTPAVTIGQASDNAGTGAAALTTFTAWNGTALTDDQYAAVTVAAGTFNLAATANITTILRCKAVDMTDGLSYLRAEVASPGSNADLIAMSYALVGLKYQGKVPPTVIA